MKTIKLVGFPEGAPAQIDLEAQTYREAIEGLKMQNFFNPKKAKNRYLVDVAEVKTSLDLEEAIVGPEVVMTFQEEVSPRQISGAGGNGMTKIVIGVILIAVAIYLPAISGYWAALGPSTAVSLNGAMALMGVSMIAGGIAQEMMPEISNESNDERSQSVGQYPNTVKSGTPKAMIFGTHKFGGHLINFNVETQNEANANMRDFADIIWDDSANNRRDTWLTLDYTTLGEQARLTWWGTNRVPGSNGGAADLAIRRYHL